MDYSVSWFCCILVIFIQGNGKFYLIETEKDTYKIYVDSDEEKNTHENNTESDEEEDTHENNGKSDEEEDADKNNMDSDEEEETHEMVWRKYHLKDENIVY